MLLKLNISKTKFTILTRNSVNRDDYVLKIRNNAIQRVNVIKYLGIMIDDHLSFDEVYCHQNIEENWDNGYIDKISK